MAKAERQPKQKPKGRILTKLLILAVLVAIGLQLRSLHSQVQAAEAQREAFRGPGFNPRTSRRAASSPNGGRGHREIR